MKRLPSDSHLLNNCDVFDVQRFIFNIKEISIKKTKRKTKEGERKSKGKINGYKIIFYKTRTFYFDIKPRVSQSNN